MMAILSLLLIKGLLLILDHRIPRKNEDKHGFGTAAYE